MKPIYYLAEEYNHFLSRELAWKFVSIDDVLSLQEQKRDYESAIWVLLLGNSSSEITLLDRFPERLLWIYLYGDETFNPKLNFLILKHKSVKGVIRPYSLPYRNFLSTQTKLWRNSMNCVLATKPFSSKSFSILFYGHAIVWRQETCKVLHKVFRKPNINSVPGYTNLFAESFLQKILNFDNLTSLVEVGKTIIVKSATKRKWLVSFVGQRGNLFRARAIEVAKDTNRGLDSKFVIRERFGGTKGSYEASVETATEYIETLSQSSYSLCPGGNYSSATFRFFESIVLGSIPLFPTDSPLDPGYELPFGVDLVTSFNCFDSEPVLNLKITNEEWRCIALALILESESFLSRVNQSLDD